MRVIGGEFGSRRLKTLPGMATRPTPDRLREALFDVLAPRIAGKVFLDAYAGSGAVGIEAISRGAARVIFIEKSRAALRVLHENLAALGIEPRVTVIAGNAVTLLARHLPDMVFLDPPYQQEGEYGAALKVLGDVAPGLVLVQHSARMPLPETAGQLRRTRVLKQGDNCVTFFEVSLL